MLRDGSAEGKTIAAGALFCIKITLLFPFLIGTPSCILWNLIYQWCFNVHRLQIPSAYDLSFLDLMLRFTEESILGFTLSYIIFRCYIDLGFPVWLSEMIFAAVFEFTKRYNLVGYFFVIENPRHRLNRRNGIRSNRIRFWFKKSFFHRYS